ncbi:hypothetical protein H7F33_09755 [Pedobacter sp. PAMC26386]|nr:hypothetical protein H7F33_09755 [Pedobacter sp. PAMC26386]
MKRLTIFTIFFLTALSVIGQVAYKQPLSDLASITFPSKPKASDTLGHSNYVYKDSSAIYIVLAKEYEDNQIALSADKIAEFYEGVVKGILEKTKGNLISISGPLLKTRSPLKQ